MLRNYFAAALRNLQRNRLTSAINIGGLAIGFATAILIGLYVRDELSFDHWIPGYANVYRVALGLQIGNMQDPPSAGTVAPMANWLKADFPQIKAAGRMRAEAVDVRHGDIAGQEIVYWADAEIFDVLPLPGIAGDVRAGLERPDGVILTRRKARKYFGVDNPVGQMLTIGSNNFTVVAVLRDLPFETHLDTQIFASGKSNASLLPPADATLRLNVGFGELASTLTYIRVNAGTQLASLEDVIQEDMERHVPIPKGPDGKPVVPVPKLFVQPLDEIHFVPAGLHAMKPAGSLTAIWSIAGIGLLILVVASINFVNLMTARISRRSMEVGVRKMAGATRKDLVLQFMGESLLTVVISCFIATSIVELILPYFNAYLGRDMTFTWWRDLDVGGSLLLATLLVGVLGSVYPALLLSGLRTISVFGREKGISGLSEVSRAALVTIQFAVLIGLLFATGVIYCQTRYATRDSLVFNADQVLVVNTDCRNAFPEEVRKLPGVKAAACTDTQFGIGGGWVFVASPPGGSQPTAITMVDADWQLLQLFNLKLLAGRFFSRDHPADVMTPSETDRRDSGSGAVIINETAVRKLGYKSPEAAIGHAAAFRGSPDAVSNGGLPASRNLNYSAPTIIGVVQDFPLQGIRHEIQPTAFQWMPGNYQYLMVKLEGSAIAETLVSIDKLWGRLAGSTPIRRKFLDDAIDALYVDVHRQSSLFASLAAIAVFVACFGLFGLSTCIAERRTREVGIRKALGAETADIVKLLMWKFATPILWANVLAWPLAGYLMNRWLHGFFYHMDISVWLYVVASSMALLLGLMTVVGHTLVVARAKPVSALRYE